MKQILEVSNITDNSYTATNYFLHEDGRKEVKTQQNHEIPSGLSQDEVLENAKGLIEPGADIEVVFSEETTPLE